MLVFKIWNLSKATDVNGGISIPCVRTEKILLQKPTAIAISENDHYFAIGFDRGSVSLYKGDISRDRSKNVKTIAAGDSQITGLAFKHKLMFVCSNSGVLVYNLYKDRDAKIVLDKSVSPIRCCALQTSHTFNEANFMVGKDDVCVYRYILEQNVKCW